jgi:hypothetical protein
LRAVDKRLGLGFKPTKKDYTKATEIKRERRIVWIEERKPYDLIMKIPNIQETFP